MTITPFQDWAPDLPTIASPGELLVNGIPLDTGYYGPARQLVEQAADMNTISATITRVTGAYYWGKTQAVFAGTRDLTAGAKLLAIASPFGTIWHDVSSTNYGTGPRNWRFTDYKNKLLAVSGSETGAPVPQIFDSASDIATVNFADVSTAPKAADIMTVRDHIVLMNTRDNTDGLVQERIWWGKSGDPTVWPTPGTPEATQAQSGRTELLRGGALVAGAPFVGRHDAVVFGENRMWAMNQQPPPIVFRFDPIEDIGLLFRQSLVAWDGVCWWLSNRGFMQYDGGAPQNIGAGKVNQFFFDDFDTMPASGVVEIYGEVSPPDSQVCWTYKSVNSPNNEPDHQIWYNWATQKWGHSDVASHVSFSAPIDTSFTRRGIWFVAPSFKLARMTGATLEFRAEPVEGFAEGSGRMWIERARPVIPGADAIELEMRLREFQGSDTYGTGFLPMERDGCVPVRKAARYWRSKVKVPAGQEWTNGIGVEYLTAPYGEMRGGAIGLSFRVDSAGNPRVDAAGNPRAVR